MGLMLRYSARSDVGMVRADNEDSGYAGSRMLVVADGMGGHAAGELASATTVATFAELDLDENIQPDDTEVLGLLAAAVDEAHEALARVVLDAPESRGMGTTLTAMAWLDDRVALAHIGDSRAYLMRAGKLVQLTKDHTFVQTLVDSGRITPDEALTHDRRNLLTRALDGVHDVDSDLSIRQVRAGDRFLLCSDGLHGVVPEADIAHVMASRADSTGVVDTLVELALAGGAPDNVTALVADVVEVPEADTNVDRSPIVVGAAAEQRNRQRLPGQIFPEDSQPSWESDPPAPEPAPLEATEATPRRRLRWPLVLGIAAIVLIVAGIVGVWSWTRTQYFVGDYNGSVTVFQGISQGFGPHGWSTVEEVSGTRVDQLPEFERSQVQSEISAASATDALRILAALATAAQACQAVPTPVGCPAVTPTPAAPAATSPAATPAAPSVPAPVPAATP